MPPSRGEIPLSSPSPSDAPRSSSSLAAWMIRYTSAQLAVVHRLLQRSLPRASPNATDTNNNRNTLCTTSDSNGSSTTEQPTWLCSSEVGRRRVDAGAGGRGEGRDEVVVDDDEISFLPRTVLFATEEESSDSGMRSLESTLIGERVGYSTMSSLPFSCSPRQTLPPQSHSTCASVKKCIDQMMHEFACAIAASLRCLQRPGVRELREWKQRCTVAEKQALTLKRRVEELEGKMEHIDAERAEILRKTDRREFSHRREREQLLREIVNLKSRIKDGQSDVLGAYLSRLFESEDGTATFDPTLVYSEFDMNNLRDQLRRQFDVRLQEELKKTEDRVRRVSEQESSAAHEDIVRYLRTELEKAESQITDLQSNLLSTNQKMDALQSSHSRLQRDLNEQIELSSRLRKELSDERAGALDRSRQGLEYDLTQLAQPLPPVNHLPRIDIGVPPKDRPPSSSSQRSESTRPPSAHRKPLRIPEGLTDEEKLKWVIKNMSVWDRLEARSILLVEKIRHQRESFVSERGVEIESQLAHVGVLEGNSRLSRDIVQRLNFLEQSGRLQNPSRWIRDRPLAPSAQKDKENESGVKVYAAGGFLVGTVSNAAFEALGSRRDIESSGNWSDLLPNRAPPFSPRDDFRNQDGQQSESPRRERLSSFAHSMALSPRSNRKQVEPLSSLQSPSERTLKQTSEPVPLSPISLDSEGGFVSSDRDNSSEIDFLDLYPLPPSVELQKKQQLPHGNPRTGTWIENESHILHPKSSSSSFRRRTYVRAR